MKFSLRLPQTTGLIFLGGAVALALGVFQVLSIPSLRQEIAIAEEDLAVLRQKNERLSEILSQTRTVESNLEVLQTALPVNDEVPALIMQLEKIAKQSGMSVQHLGFGQSGGSTKPSSDSDVTSEESRGGVETISLTVVIDGSYPSLQTFFRNLERASRVINVTNFRFSSAQKKGGEEGGGSGLSVTLGAEAFYLAEIKEVTINTPLTLDTTSKDYTELVRKVKALRVYKSGVLE